MSEDALLERLPNSIQYPLAGLFGTTVLAGMIGGVVAVGWSAVRIYAWLFEGWPLTYWSIPGVLTLMYFLMYQFGKALQSEDKRN